MIGLRVPAPTSCPTSPVITRVCGVVVDAAGVDELAGVGVGILPSAGDTAGAAAPLVSISFTVAPEI